jgi:hypothetical protein
MKSYSAIDVWIQDLNIVEGLKQLLIEAGLTIESTIGLGSEKMSKILHIDPYIGKLFVDAAQNVMQESYTKIKV